MPKKPKNKTTLRPHARFKKYHPPVTTKGKPMVNLVRAGEILGLGFDTIKKYIENGKLPASAVIGIGGKTSYAIAIPDLIAFRDMLIKRYKTFTGSVYAQKADRLQSTNLNKLLFSNSDSNDSDNNNSTATTTNKGKK